MVKTAFTHHKGKQQKDPESRTQGPQPCQTSLTKPSTCTENKLPCHILDNFTQRREHESNKLDKSNPFQTRVQMRKIHKHYTAFTLCPFSFLFFFFFRLYFVSFYLSLSLSAAMSLSVLLPNYQVWLWSKQPRSPESEAHSMLLHTAITT